MRGKLCGYANPTEYHTKGAKFIDLSGAYHTGEKCRVAVSRTRRLLFRRKKVLHAHAQNAIHRPVHKDGCAHFLWRTPPGGASVFDVLENIRFIKRMKKGHLDTAA